MNWLKRQYLAFMSGYNVYRLTLSSFKGGFDPRPMLIAALEQSLEADEDDEWDDGALDQDDAHALHALNEEYRAAMKDDLGRRGRSTRH